MRKYGVEVWKGMKVAEYALYVIDLIVAGDMEWKGEHDREEFYHRAQDEPKILAALESNKGRRVHLFAKKVFEYLMDPKEEPAFDVDPDIEIPCDALLKWLNDHKVQPILTEQVVWTLAHGGYAGQVDAILYVDNHLLTTELKSTNKIWHDADLQVCAYDLAFNTMPDTGIKTEGAAVLRLDKTSGQPEFRYYSKKEIEILTKEYRHWCAIWYTHKEFRDYVRELKDSGEFNKLQEISYNPGPEGSTGWEGPDPF